VGARVFCSNRTGSRPAGMNLIVRWSHDAEKFHDEVEIAQRVQEVAAGSQRPTAGRSCSLWAS